MRAATVAPTGRCCIDWLNLVYEDPKHGEFGVIADASSQIESYLSTIDKNIAEIAREKR